MGYIHPGAEALSEFARKTGGSYLNGTCVETAAFVCALCNKQQEFQGDIAHLGDYLQSMVTEWRAEDPAVSLNGSSNFGDATDWLRDKGLQADQDILPQVNFMDEMRHRIPQGYTYIIGVTNAQGLPGDEPGVHNHGLAAVGVDDAGNIICADGDNWKANVNMPGNPVGLFVTYSESDLRNGSISSLTRVYPLGSNTMGVPTGWKDDGTTLTDPAGGKAVMGFREYILAHAWDASDTIVKEEWSVDQIVPQDHRWGKGSVILTRYHALTWAAAPDPAVGHSGVGVFPLGEGVGFMLKNPGASGWLDATDVVPTPAPVPAPTPTPSVDFAGVQSDLQAASKAISDAEAKLPKA